MRHELSRFVERDLDAIAAMIAESDPRKAVSLIREIRQHILLVAQQPQFHRPWPEAGEGAHLTIAADCLILFRIVGGRVRFERVVWGGADLPALLRGQ